MSTLVDYVYSSDLHYDPEQGYAVITIPHVANITCRSDKVVARWENGAVMVHEHLWQALATLWQYDEDNSQRTIPPHQGCCGHPYGCDCAHCD